MGIMDAVIWVDQFIRWAMLQALGGVFLGLLVGYGVGWYVYKWRYAALRKRAIRARESRDAGLSDG